MASVIGALKAVVAGATEPSDIVHMPDVKEAVWQSVSRETELDFYDKVSPKWTVAIKPPPGRSMLLDLRAETFVYRPLEVDDYQYGPEAPTDSCAAIYGLASSMPSGPVSDVLRLYTDITLRA